MTEAVRGKSRGLGIIFRITLLELNTMFTKKETAPTLAETAHDAKAAAQDLGRSAASKMDHARSDAADALHAAASAVRSTGSQAASRIDHCAEETGQMLDSTSKCIGKHGPTEMIHNLRTILRRHPVPSLFLTP